MNETLINIVLWTACSIVAFLAAARMLRKPDPEPERVRVRVEETDR